MFNSPITSALREPSYKQVNQSTLPSSTTYADILRSMNVQGGGFTPMSGSTPTATPTTPKPAPIAQPKAPITAQTPVTAPTAPVKPQETEAPKVGSVQYDIANGLPLGTSSQAGYKPPVQTNQNGSVTSTLTQMLGGVVKPTSMDQATRDAEEKAARDRTEQALLSAYAPQLNALNEAMNNELSANDDEAKGREQAMLQNLAVRGILNVSSEDPEIRKKYYAGEAKISSAIRDKYTLQRLSILGKIGDDAYKAGLKRVDDIINSEKSAMENYYKELESQRETYKTLSDEQLREKELELSKEQARIQEEYNKGRITIDKYNAETNRLKAESDKLVNEAQIRKTNAETGKINSETTKTAPNQTKEHLQFLKDTAKNALNHASASGRSGIRKTVEGVLVGSTDYTALQSYTDTLKTNLMTLSTDPTIKKFFGPQMTNRDVELMTSAGTTLNTEKQSPEQMTTEINRITDLLNRMDVAVQNGIANEAPVTPQNQSVNTTYQVGNTIYELGADGRYYPKQ